MKDTNKWEDEFIFLYKTGKAIDSLKKEEFEKFIRNLSDYTPEDLYNLLEKEGYRGQKEARKMVCVAVYRHLRKINFSYVSRKS